MIGDRISRGILIGGALGAFANIFGFTQNLFMSIGFGMLAGCLAGLTIAIRKKKTRG